MARIAVGGFQHETNTFAPVKADFAVFVTADAWPGLIRGAEIAPAVAGMNIPIAGGIEGLVRTGHELVPLLWCAAQPSAHVTEDAFERIAAMMIDGLRHHGPVDGVYLDLHGAMVTEHLLDGDGEILRRVRETVGSSVPVVASLDLHANIGETMVEHASLMTAYRTYPHIDMAETGRRAARVLDRLLRTDRPTAVAFRQIPFLVPLIRQSTFDEPAKSLYAELDGIAADADAELSLACGFHLADVPDCGPSVLAYAETRERAQDAAEALAKRVLDARPKFVGRAWPPVSAVAEALSRARSADRPIVLADSNDNPGAGATCGTVAVLHELVRQKAAGAVFGLLFDSPAAATAHEAGEGARVTLHLGSASLAADDPPFEGLFRVMRLGNGRFTGSGPFYYGAPMDLGPMALLRHDSGVLVAVASRKQQAADQEMFRHLGVEPAATPILVLKSSVHYRADFEPIAHSLIVIDGPGAAPLDLDKLDYRHLRPGVARR